MQKTMALSPTIPQRIHTLAEIMRSLRGGKTKSRNTRPRSRPVIKKIISQSGGAQVLEVRSDLLPERFRIPHDASHYQVWIKTGGLPDTDPYEYRLIGEFNTGQARIKFEFTEQGHRVHYLLRWMNRFDEPGPWSDVYSVLIV